MTTTPSIFNLAADWQWVLRHLVVILVMAGLVWGGIYGVQSIIASHDLATEQKYEQILAKQAEVTKAVEDKLDADTKAHAIEALAYQQQIAADQQAMKARDAMLAQLIAKISTMTAPQVVADLQPKLRQGTATALADGVKLDLPAARDVDEQITEGANAKADLATTQTNLAKETTIAGNAQADLAEAKTAITAEQAKNADQVKVCNAQITTLKAEARKSKMKWYLGGVVTGFLLRLVTHA